MSANVVIFKAKAKDMAELRKLARELTEEHYSFKQADVFYKGLGLSQLKLRGEEYAEPEPFRSMLVDYFKPTVPGSTFFRNLTPVAHPLGMGKSLSVSKCNGLMGHIEKTREVFNVDRNGLSARVHLDEVKGLGNFVKFEVSVKEESQLDEAQDFVEYLSEYFGILEEDTLSTAYIDDLMKMKNK